MEGYILTMANVKKSPPISSFIFFNVPIIPRHGPHHSEYTSTTVMCSKYEINFFTWKLHKTFLVVKNDVFMRCVLEYSLNVTLKGEEFWDVLSYDGQPSLIAFILIFHKFFH
jgi:hypothetical protein